MQYISSSLTALVCKNDLPLHSENVNVYNRQRNLQLKVIDIIGVFLRLNGSVFRSGIPLEFLAAKEVVHSTIKM